MPSKPNNKCKAGFVLDGKKPCGKCGATPSDGCLFGAPDHDAELARLRTENATLLAQRDAADRAGRERGIREAREIAMRVKNEHTDLGREEEGYAAGDVVDALDALLAAPAEGGEGRKT